MNRMRTVLVVDDSHAAIAFATAVLRAAGFEADGAINIAEMVACLERRAPDALLVDVEMPELKGHDLVRYLREVYKITAPILLLSGMEEAKLATLAKSSGADGFVRKSSDTKAIPAAIEAVLAARG